MTYVDDGIIRQRGESLIQRLVHLRRVTFEEPAASYQLPSSAFSILPSLSKPVPKGQTEVDEGGALPLMKSVSPVNTTLCAPSSMK